MTDRRKNSQQGVRAEPKFLRYVCVTMVNSRSLTDHGDNGLSNWVYAEIQRL